MGSAIDYQTSFDPEIEDICHVLLTAVAAYENTSPVTLPPLNEAVDPDALFAFFQTRDNGPELADRSANFTYAGYEVHINSKGVLTLSATPTNQQ